MANCERSVHGRGNGTVRFCIPFDYSLCDASSIVDGSADGGVMIYYVVCVLRLYRKRRMRVSFAGPTVHCNCLLVVRHSMWYNTRSMQVLTSFMRHAMKTISVRYRRMIRARYPVPSFVSVRARSLRKSHSKWLRDSTQLHTRNSHVASPNSTSKCPKSNVYEPLSTRFAV